MPVNVWIKRLIFGIFLRPLQVATDKVAGKLSSTLSWVKNSVSHTVSQMASQVAPPTSLQTPATSSSTSLSSPALSPSSPAQLSPDDVELLAKLEEQNRLVPWLRHKGGNALSLKRDGLFFSFFKAGDDCLWEMSTSGYFLFFFNICIINKPKNKALKNVTSFNFKVTLEPL